MPDSSLLASGIRVARAGITHLNLEIRPGELHLLIGPNGAGKSTALRTLSGELRPDLGTVTLDGAAIDSIPRRDRARRIGVLPQESHPAFPLSAFEVALLGRMPHHRSAPGASDRRAALHSLRLCGAEPLAERRFPTLSGGEKARVQLARVLAQIGSTDPAASAPRFLLLDEPTAALDPVHQESIMRLLRTLAGADIGVLAIVHDLLLAARHAHRITVLDKGAIAACGTPEQVLCPEVIGKVFGLSVEWIPRAGRPAALVLEPA